MPRPQPPAENHETEIRRNSDTKVSPPRNGLQPLTHDHKLLFSKHHLPISRTHSSPIVDPDSLPSYHRKERGRETRKIVRSISDPDLIASGTYEILDGSEVFEVLDFPERSSSVRSSLRETKPLGTDNAQGKPKLRESPQHAKQTVRYSQDTVESAANAIEQMLMRSQTHSAGTSNSSFRPFAGVIQRAKLRKEREKEKKKRTATKVTNSSENIVDETITELSGNHIQEEERSLSGSPPDSQSPTMTRKTSKGSVSSLFKKRNKKKESLQKLKSSASQSEKLGQEYSSKEPSLSPPAQSSPDRLNTLTNGHEDSVFVDGNAELLTQRLPKRDPSHKVSRPFMTEKKEPEMVNYNFQKMVLPVPNSWVKCSYLWLRMKLPNNRYAWTYIVSVCVIQQEILTIFMFVNILLSVRHIHNNICMYSHSR